MLLAVARLAPTAHNYQPQRLLVLNTEDSLKKLKDCTNGHFNAPLAIIVCYDNTVSWKREYDDADMGVVDASIVGSHIMFTVADIGYGKHNVGSHNASIYNPHICIIVFSLPAHRIIVTNDNCQRCIEVTISAIF